MPSLVVCSYIKEIRVMFVDYLFWDIVHCLEGFWGKSIETRCFPLFQFVDCMSDFFEGDWRIDGGKTWFLFNKVEYCVVYRPLIVQNLWKCMLKMDMFFLALEASSPFSSFIAMLMLVLW